MRSDREGWEFMAAETEAATILRAALKSGDSEARSVATALIHELGGRGMFGFRQLLSLE
jgi:formate-dependent phosphoribosylglycinamide formyltransferase (GAR transformylase)